MRNKRQYIIFSAGTVLLIFLVFMIFSRCKEEGPPEVFYTEEELLISAYLEEHPDEFSSLLTVLEMTNIKPILNAYGHYTFFAPDNNAFEEFCADNNVSSVEDLDVNYLRTTIKYHLIGIDVETNFLPNGVLSDTTYSGDNLIFTFTEGGLESITINGIATITERDIKVENGHINRIDKVLAPPVNSVFGQLKEDPEYSIFTEALEATGIKDTLNVIYVRLNDEKYIRSRFTIFAESNQVYQGAGIFSLNDLKARYSDSEDITDHENGLNKFMAYHCLPGVYYLNQIDSFNYNTLAKNKLINVTIRDSIYLNWHTVIVSEQPEEWYVNVIHEKSNNPGKNGVYHSIDKIMEVYDPEPIFFKFDFTDYQGIEIGGIYTEKDLQYINGLSTENTGLWYRMSVLDEDSSYLETTTSNIGWVVEFELPPIIKGKYRIFFTWVSTQTRTYSVQAFWDGELFGSDFSMERHKRPPQRPPEWLYEFRVKEELGVANLLETRSHTIKFIALQDGFGGFDYLTFEPF